ncbi:lantibiotic dehydratase [Mucilaginibacter angelicae]
MFDRERYDLLNKVFVRAPYYSFTDYGPDRLAEVLGDDAFRKALYLASPQFYRALEKKGFGFELLDAKERFSLLKYYNRMCFRPTPFGAFASFSLTEWSDVQGLRFSTDAGTVLHLAPALWCREGQGTEARAVNPVVQVNRTLYRFSAEFRYTGWLEQPSGKYGFSMKAIAAERLNSLLIRAAGEGIRYADLAALLVEKSGCTAAEAAQYMDFLLTEQVLLADRGAGLIGQPGRDQLPAGSEGNEGGKVRQVVFPAGFGMDEAAPENNRGESGFYAGLERTAGKGGVARHYQEGLWEAVNSLRKLLRPVGSPALKQFIADFSERFDRQKVPLLLALDPEAGIAYADLVPEKAGPQLLGDLPFGHPAEKDEQLEWTPGHRLLFRLWMLDRERSPFDPIQITEQDLAGLEEPLEPLPPSFPVMFRFGEGKMIVESAGGVTAAAIIGRFSVFSEEVGELCRDITAAEAQANPDVVFAELHQRSHRHVDNINRRGQVYGRVISLNTFADGGLAEIALSDLLLSVRGAELVLELALTGERVIPRLPTAYNFRHNELAVFRLLCDLQFQGVQANLTLEMRKLFPGLPFYPRVCLNNTVVSPAKWYLSDAEVARLAQKPFSLGRLHLFREKRGVPPWVSFGLGDRLLVFDLADDRQGLFFLECLQGQRNVQLQEYLVPDRSLLAGNKPLAGQLVAFFSGKDRVYRSTGPSGLPGAGAERRFMPGGEWLYLKIYCSAGVADRLLSGPVSGALRRYRARIRCWFFVRYQDPAPHIRLRIRAAEQDTPVLLATLKGALSKGGYGSLVRGLQTETYEREIERYGADLIHLTEDVFWAGSELFLAMPDGAEGELWPFKVVHELCRRALDTPGKLAAFLGNMTEKFLTEFGGEKELRVGMDGSYRSLRKKLVGLLAGEDWATGALKKTPDMLLEKLDLLFQAARPEARRASLLADVVHMQVNRMYPARQREYEALIYFCLYKYEHSRQERLRRQAEVDDVPRNAVISQD